MCARKMISLITHHVTPQALDATGDLGMELKALRHDSSLEDAEAGVPTKVLWP